MPTQGSRKLLPRVHHRRQIVWRTGRYFPTLAWHKQGRIRVARPCSWRVLCVTSIKCHVRECHFFMSQFIKVRCCKQHQWHWVCQALAESLYKGIGFALPGWTDEHAAAIAFSVCLFVWHEWRLYLIVLFCTIPWKSQTATTLAPCHWCQQIHWICRCVFYFACLSISSNTLMSSDIRALYTLPCPKQVRAQSTFSGCPNSGK